MESNYAYLTVYFSIIIGLFIICYYIPFLNRETIIFGIRIPVEEIKNQLVEQLKRHYKHTYMAVMIPYIILFEVASFGLYSRLILLFGIVLQVIIAMYLYVLFNHKMMVVKNSFKEKSQENIEQAVFIDTNFREGKYLVSVAWFIPSLIIIVLSALIIAMNYDKIPSIIATRFDAVGKAVQFSPKTDFAVYLMQIISFVALAMFAGIYYAIKRSKQQISSNYPEKAKQQDRRFRYIWSGYIVILSFIFTLYLAIISFKIDQIIDFSNSFFLMLNVAFPIIILFGTIFLAIKTGQSGSRIKVHTNEPEIKLKVADDNVYWKLGLFYYNPEDPSLFIPKRMGIGWTLNFGHPVSFILLIVLVALPFVFKLMGKH